MVNLLTELHREADVENYDEEMPQYPGRVLIWHCTKKVWQMGAVLGCAGTAIYLGVRRLPFQPYYWNAGYVCLGVSTALWFPVMFRIASLDEPGIDDRGFRLSKNEGQKDVDKWAFGGAVITPLFTSPFVPTSQSITYKTADNVRKVKPASVNTLLPMPRELATAVAVGCIVGMVALMIDSRTRRAVRGVKNAIRDKVQEKERQQQ
ncbi:unnamed protein product [Vitrella brassicaformis CCMP3155]|uniref:Uncharacterized protein n=1 Tax=Vitrella brassicaformis (strain CCMP3155) TaxID=1169540 RepID=A0A0G4EDN9_VITBC|nr:unnamed protein product [Vitrella brassicaformis CCMP3155]|mmetsp:Transcript_15695/g.37446  ORF Transcript_15695/g.37446 Transcript_15695/m.37446 type:complete len:206 (-) Transcript_15695:1399-2016(-)|eukprot:CEL93507.1 unnamed protein product [Vitrella brassicaformis CCMP3155]